MSNKQLIQINFLMKKNNQPEVSMLSLKIKYILCILRGDEVFGYRTCASCLEELMYITSRGSWRFNVPGRADLGSEFRQHQLIQQQSCYP